MDDQEGQIRQRAYDLWVEAGRPEGDPEQFWYQAAKELTGTDSAASDDGVGSSTDQELDAELKASFPAGDPPSQP